MKTDTYTALGWAAMLAVPIAPAFFFGWQIFSEVMTLTAGLWPLAAPVAVISAAGLEIIGMLAGHTAIEFWKRASNERAAVAGIIMLAYTAIGLYQLRGTAGAMMFLIAPLAYILVALRSTLGDEKAAEQVQARVQRQIDAEERAHQRKLTEEKLRLEHEEKLAQIKARAEVQVARASTPPPPPPVEPAVEPALPAAEPAPEPALPARTIHQCEDCNAEFGSVQALNAHTRFCPARHPQANGKVQHDA